MLTMKQRIETASVALVFDIVSNPEKFAVDVEKPGLRPIVEIAQVVIAMTIRERAEFFETLYNELNDEQRAEYRSCTGGKTNG